ncbi:MAG TPA: NADH-quinone oxidoreductase subunit C [Armatimonadota bacterium]|nr:NADH-quinone oxidoreductase subunit C [Armatimonadota bacterium]
MSDSAPAAADTPAESPEPPPEHPLVVALREGVTGLSGVTVTESRGMTLAHIPDAGRIVDVCRFLKTDGDWEFVMLIDIVAVDHRDSEPRFGLTYTLHSISKNQRIFLKIRVPGGAAVVPTMTTLWSGANWMEREVFDMFGVRFAGHPDLRKILTPDDLEGHPLRKDFPLGNVDVWPEGADTNVAR